MSRARLGANLWIAARSRARLAWDATEGERPPLAEMLATLGVQRRSRRWHAEGGRFVPAAWNYLQQARWEDDGSAYPPVQSSRIVRKQTVRSGD